MRSLIACCLVAACGSSHEAPARAPTSAPVDTERVAPPSKRELVRQQVIEQARTAGILGANDTDVPNQPGQPEISIGAPAPAAGARDRAAIRTAVLPHITAIRACYESRLLEDPNLAGTTMVQLVIARDGTVSSSAGSGFDPKVDACVAKVLAAITFAPASITTDVNYPFRFHR